MYCPLCKQKADKSYYTYHKDMKGPQPYDVRCLNPDCGHIYMPSHVEGQITSFELIKTKKDFEALKKENEELRAENEKHRWRSAGAQVGPTPEAYETLKAENESLNQKLAELQFELDAKHRPLSEQVLELKLENQKLKELKKMNTCKVDNTSWSGDIQNCPTCQDKAIQEVKAENARLLERIEKLRAALKGTLNLLKVPDHALDDEYFKLLKTYTEVSEIDDALVNMPKKKATRHEK